MKPVEPLLGDPAPVEFRALKRVVVAADAMQTIKQMIVSGELRAGQRLPAERDLAVQLGVSRPSLREAIRALVALKILESRHGEGTFVSSLEPELLAEPIDFVLQVNELALQSLFEARRVLEAGVAALAAERATDLELADLENFARAGRAFLHDLDAHIEHDIEFHDRIRRAARSPILGSLLTSITALALESRRRSVASPRVRKQTTVDHEAIVRALKSRDADAAHAAMVEHLDHVRPPVAAGDSGQVA